MNDIAGRSPSGVRIAGDYYQHLVAWNETLEALRPGKDVIAVTVEHPGAGNVDDIVVHRHIDPDLYTQVKHAVDASTPVGYRWLTSSKPTGSSVLQKFHRSWRDLSKGEKRPELRLITDREIDSNDQVMKGIDRTTELLVPDIGRRRAAQDRARWAQHLGVTETELLEFLEDLRFMTGRPLAAEQQRATTLMWALGLNSDQQAIDSAIGLIREWVQRRNRNLKTDVLWDWAQQRVGRRTMPGALVVIEGIDYDPHPDDASERITFVDDYQGDNPYDRRQLRDPSQWSRIGREIEQAAQRLRNAGIHRVLVRGAMRLPVWFTAGAAFRHVRGFETAGVQNDAVWSSEDLSRSAQVDIDSIDISNGPGAAVAVGVATNPTLAVRNYITAVALPVGSLTSILPVGGPNPGSIPHGAAAAAVAVAVRDAVRYLLETTTPSHIHLFLATPGALALLLGHRWNALCPTTVYEHLGPSRGYTPTLHISA